MWHDWGTMAWGWGGMVFQLLFLIVFIIAIVWAVKRVAGQNRSNTSSSGGDSALDILKKRYAKGEIDKEEFEQKKRDLV
ncbi:hypothetical protein BMS3Abin05_00021 [bacterium BMS3Abin05]|nr:hypothetical protein BMS3Abin05_00021 [bacterium BMS3Abin05]GBE27860.1 hypothetical protein BMS3Bbin03_01790 [bacterium BMS3Bbin03]HDZ13230.1 hypothetical protein [Bacteroidota bacterium]